MIYASPGASFEATFNFGETGLVGTLGVAIMDGDTATVARTTSGINEIAATGVYVFTGTAPSTAGQYVLLADDGAATPFYVSDDLTVTQTGRAPDTGVFATYADVATRMGVTLTSAQQAQATAVIAMVEDLIAEAVYKDSDWAAALDPVPATLTNICVEKAILSLANPKGLESETETLGAYSHTERFNTKESIAAMGIFLNAADRAKARRAVYGSNVSTVRTATVLEEYLEDALGS